MTSRSSFRTFHSADICTFSGLAWEDRFARDSPLEEAGFELSVPQKTFSVPGRLRFPFAADYFSLPGNQAEATSGVLRTLVVSRGTESSKPASRSCVFAGDEAPLVELDRAGC